MWLFLWDSEPSKIFVGDTQISKVFLWDTQVRPSGWKPDPTRTVFYYDFEDSNNRLADSSWNNNNATGATNITYSTVGTQTVAETTAGGGGITIPQNLYGNIGTWDFALSFWLYCIDTTNTQYPMLFWLATLTSPYPWINIFFNPRNAYNMGNATLWRLTWNNSQTGYKTASTLVWWWHHFVMTRNSWTVDCYIDATLDQTFTDNTSLPSYCWQNRMLSRVGNTSQSFPAWAKGDKYILEKVWWSSQDVTNYYNWTKWNYWL